MSGVVGQKLGRKKSATSVWKSSWAYSVSSSLVVRHVKYVYELLKPSLASVCIIFGRVNASDRKMRSGCSRRSSPMHHCQKGMDLVWGLSTRKTRTPWSIQNSNTLLSSSQSACQSDRKSTRLNSSHVAISYAV